ncbi:PH domain-containing protein [Isoptericola croceus]|uniref:PH domain-containing protein n=1 Tax=Isoptericola croceus TaxID=3031406 RepID=UPI0023F97F6C|nr:PH domain-containing protein [Isoptericola croceus]
MTRHQGADTEPGADTQVVDETVLEREVPVTAGTASWLRLDAKMIWVDVAQSLLSLTPAAIATWVIGVDPTWGAMWPFVLVAVLGVIGAARDALRWTFTRYRMSDEYVERRTGIVVRRYRSVRRDRIRSIDVTAKLRHRLAGLRVVLIGAGQQLATGESALSLDALNRHDAAALRQTLLSTESVAPGARTAPPDRTDVPTGPSSADRSAKQVIARFRPSWVVYNVVGVWSVVAAAGLLWGAYWLVAMFGLDPETWIRQNLGPGEVGWTVTIGITLIAVLVIGTMARAVGFFSTHWRFELARVPGDGSTQLRTRQGLLTTREVNRDDRRLRGVHVSEPVLWRWLGVADTEVITTGLSIWSGSTSILPRGPLSVAQGVAGDVLEMTPGPFSHRLVPHPRAALRRRLWWATVVGAAVTGTLGWLASNGVVPMTTLWWGAVSWAFALASAVVAYRSLGHTIAGRYLVVRSGLMSRATTVLRRDAVSTIALRESILQRRLGLRTVSAMTAAGWGVYEAPDIATDEALAFAVEAAPGLLEPFLENEPEPEDAPSPVPVPGPARQ